MELLSVTSLRESHSEIAVTWIILGRRIVVLGQGVFESEPQKVRIDVDSNAGVINIDFHI